jgi:hypothetical protein
MFADDPMKVLERRRFAAQLEMAQESIHGGTVRGHRFESSSIGITLT